MALHVRGVVLPDDEVRDLWLVGDRVTFDPGGRGARRSATAGSSCPGWSTRTATSASPTGRRPIDEPGRGPRRWPPPTGTPGCSRFGTRDRRTPIPSWTTSPACRDWPAPAGTSRPPKRYLRDIGVEVDARRRGRDGDRAGGGRHRLGEAGRRLDRRGPPAISPRPGTRPPWPRRSRPRTPPGPGRRCTRSPRRRVRDHGAGRGGLGRARHRAVAST